MRALSAQEGEAARPAIAEPVLGPIHIVTRDADAVGWFAPRGERLTDILQRGDQLIFFPEHARREPAKSWMRVTTDALLFVVPPPHVSPPERRLHRQRQGVLVRVGPYTITGTAHLRPGFEHDLWLRSTQPFLPLTEALVTRGPEEPRRFDVVIVNMREAEEFREL
jgi:hypothetical protein